MQYNDPLKEFIFSTKQLWISKHIRHGEMRLININLGVSYNNSLIIPSLFYALLDRRHTIMYDWELKEGLRTVLSISKDGWTSQLLSYWDWFKSCKSLSEFWSGICGGWILMGTYVAFSITKSFCWWRHVHADPPQMLIKSLLLYFLYIFLFNFPSRLVFQGLTVNLNGRSILHLNACISPHCNIILT